MKRLLPWTLLALLSLTGFHLFRTSRSSPSLPPAGTPPRTAFARRIAGFGIVEAATENISIGAHVPGVVSQVHVRVGQQVDAGAPLFQIDDRQAQADLAVREAMWQAAQAQLEKLEQLPRPEELPGSEARVRETEARRTDEEERGRRAELLFERRALSEEELTSRRRSLQMAREQHARAKAEDALLRAGAWGPDKAVAQANVAQAASLVAQQKTEVERLTVRAPVAGLILQLNVRPGEFVQQGGGQPGGGQPLLLLGGVDQLHVRVQIDEDDIPRFDQSMPARGVLRGGGGVEYQLHCVRVEPLVTAKKSLTGSPTERIDTRVLQVVYAVQPSPTSPSLHVGQQLDVFIAVEEKPTAEQPPTNAPPDPTPPDPTHRVSSSRPAASDQSASRLPSTRRTAAEAPLTVDRPR
jgi:multidrug resistance efflux pump